MKRIVIHGGIKEFEGGYGQTQEYQDALREVVREAYPVLCEDGARHAVLCAVRALEDHILFNAGTGSRIQADGEIRMSAALMDGTRHEFSGVVNIQYVKNPIDVAARLASEEHKVLAGAAATRYARAAGFDSHSPYTDHRMEEFRARETAKSGTVGAVAVDDRGAIFVGTSTGGVGGETPGRVSDSATVAGTYATHKMGVSLTGAGEQIVNHAVAARIGVRVDDGDTLSHAVEKTIAEAKARDYDYGLIALDHEGRIVVNQTRGTTLCAYNDATEIVTF